MKMSNVKFKVRSLHYSFFIVGNASERCFAYLRNSKSPTQWIIHAFGCGCW